MGASTRTGYHDAQALVGYGNKWQLATRVEEVSEEDLQQRIAEMFRQSPG